MHAFLVYWLWPNPAGWAYGDQKVLSALGVSLALIVVSFVLRAWRSKSSDPKFRSLSSSWSSAALWFGLLAAILIVCRVETIQFLSMRLLWAMWLLGLILFAGFQTLKFRQRYYRILSRTQVVDERDKYLPRSKR